MAKSLLTLTVAASLVLAAVAVSDAGYVFTDQTPTAPIISGDYQRYVSLLGDGSDLQLWYENRTAGNIEMRTSTTGYTGFGSATATTGLAGLAHPRVCGGGGGSGGYVGFFWDSTQSPPNGIKRLMSADGVNWSGAADLTIAGSPGTSSIWGVCGYFEDVSGTTDVLYYTRGTGATEDIHRATATDGLTFTHQGTAFQNPGGDYGAGVSVGGQVLYDSKLGHYVLIWCAESITKHVAFATSNDGGLTFTNAVTVVPDSAGHTDLEETSFILNAGELVGVYTADFGGDSSNHVGAYTATFVVPEPAAWSLTVPWLLWLVRTQRK